MKKILIIILSISVLIFVFGSFALGSFAKQVLEKKQQLSLTKQEEKNLPQIRNFFAERENDLLMLEKTFPKKEELISVVQSIDTLAARKGVAASLHFESEQPILDENRDFVIPVTITVEGDYPDCLAFLESLTHNQYLFVLQNIDGNSPDGIKKKHTLVVKGNLYAANE